MNLQEHSKNTEMVLIQSNRSFHIRNITMFKLGNSHSLQWKLPRFHATNSSGWWYIYPSRKCEFVSWDDDIPNIQGKTKHVWDYSSQYTRKNKTCSSHHQPVVSTITLEHPEHIDAFSPLLLFGSLLGQATLHLWDVASGKCGYPLVSSNMAGWEIPINDCKGRFLAGKIILQWSTCSLPCLITRGEGISTIPLP